MHHVFMKNVEPLKSDAAVDPDEDYLSTPIPQDMLSDVGTGTRPLSRTRAKFLLWARRHNLGRRLELLLSILAVIAAIATYVTISRKSAPFEVTSGRTTQVLLIVALVLILAMATIIGRRVTKFLLARKLNAPGSRLHTRVLTVFSAIAITPPIIMAIFSASFLELSVQSWFSEKVRNTINNSLEVAEGYLVEHRANTEKDLLAIVFAYNRLSPSMQNDSITLQQLASDALNTRLLSEVLIIEERGGQGAVIARASNTLGLGTSRLTSELISRVRNGDVVVVPNMVDSTVYGIMRLQNFLQPTYVFVSRDLDPKVLEYLQATREAVTDYANLEGEKSNILFQFNAVFILVALLILLAAILFGLRFSSRLVTPLVHLVDAAERVGKGDLEARVPYSSSADEVGTLSRAFNRMTDQLALSQTELISTNQELDERRRFLEEVLAGVSAGVIGLNTDSTIFMPNRSACELLHIPKEKMINAMLVDIVPEMGPLLEQAQRSEEYLATGQIELEIERQPVTLLVRISVEMENEQALGYVVTFDDLTDQLADQRTAAWADVARRIAHEIKNPLTPIQLSAERLKRKYSKEILSEPHVFEQCTETIIRQVGDLRRMVDEFSSFSRMPKPVFKQADIQDVIRQAVFLQDVAWREIRIRLTTDGPIHPIICDGRLLGQALTNIIKNAAESVTARIHEEAKDNNDTSELGWVDITLSQSDDHTLILIQDNGIGLPPEQKDRLMDPYVTTRATGTGLGLAIVRKIIEEHGGRVRLKDRMPIGAIAEIYFSHAALVKRAHESEQQTEDETNAI